MNELRENGFFYSEGEFRGALIGADWNIARAAALLDAAREDFEKRGSLYEEDYITVNIIAKEIGEPAEEVLQAYAATEKDEQATRELIASFNQSG
jgi:hypothetical protein